MDKITLRKLKDFFTIHKQEYSHFLSKMQDKKHKLFYQDFLPPMYKCVVNPSNKQGPYSRPPVSFTAPIGFKKNPIPDDIKHRFAENIAFQEDIMRIVKKRTEEFSYPCGIIKAKTGMGKSIIAMDLIEYYQNSTLILVTNTKLMQEMIDKFKEMTNFTPAQYGGGKKEIDYITVMTKKSFGLIDPKEIQDFDSVIIDEVHQGFTKDFIKNFNQYFAKAQHLTLHGLSATPSTNDLDQEDLEKYFGKVIEIEKEYDFIPEFYFYNYTHNPSAKFTYIDEESEEEMIQFVYEYEHHAELRNNMCKDEDRFDKQISVITQNLSNTCSLILCDRLEEIEMFYDFYNQDMYTAVKITGETKIDDDKRLLEEAKGIGKPIVIIGSIQKCSTGFDFPIIDTVFIFSAIKFRNTTIQSIGRSLRKSHNKTGAKIHIWNDKILDKQRLQKQQTIKKEYGVVPKVSFIGDYKADKGDIAVLNF